MEDNDRKPRSLNPGKAGDERKPFTRGPRRDERESSERRPFSRGPRREDGDDRRRSDDRPRGGDASENGRSFSRTPRRDDDRGPSGQGRPASGGSRRDSDDRGSRGSSDGRSFSRGPRRESDQRDGRSTEGRSFARGTRRDDDNRGPRDTERKPYSRGPRRDDAEDRGPARTSRDGDSRGPHRFSDDDRGVSRPARGSRPQETERRPRREDLPPKEWRPGLKPREDEPDTPTDVDLRSLPRQVKAELRGLPPELAEKVGAHLVAAGMLIDEDPELAYRHAEAARRRASRLPIIREAAAETAYAAGDYAHALTEFRALRRMSGNPEYLHVMADCERALGKPEAALKLIREAQSHRPDDTQAVELRLVEAGVREDMGQKAESLRILKSSIEEFVDGPPLAQARLRFAYAEALLARGKEEPARKWLESAVRLDPEDESGAAERLAELDGLVLDLDFTEDEDDEAGGDLDPEDVEPR